MSWFQEPNYHEAIPEKNKKNAYALLSIMSQKLGHCGIKRIAALKKGVVGNRRGKEEKMRVAHLMEAWC